ncbi:hypothetical protein GQ53DRAFT_754861 [Thozetella sp. PMI_491]|nr:hypothetical protein GQ53DRAFT_754861 [Thozetella sp. PMI_491]
MDVANLSSLSCTALEARRVSAPAPWTTARCLRLLRPLAANISSLKKYSQPSPAAADCRKRPLAPEAEDAAVRRVRQRTYSRAETRGRRGRGRPPAREAARETLSLEEFLAPATPEKAQEVYSERQTHLKCRHSVCSWSTPAERPESAEKCFFERELGYLRRLVGLDLYRNYESILRDLDSILRATTEDGDAAEPAPKSLLGLCLRKIPDAIAHQEAFEEQEAEENRAKTFLDQSHVSSSFYSMIESRLSVADGTGYTPLKTVVRAHALRSISQINAMGIPFGTDFCCVAISLCRTYRVPLRELEGLVTSITDARMPNPTAVDSDVFKLDTMRPFLLPRYSGHGYRALTHRVLSRVLANDNLPLEWIWTSRFTRIWERAMEAFSQEDSCTDVMGLVASTVALVGNHKAVEGPEQPPLCRRRSSRMASLEPGDVLFPLLTRLAAAVVHSRGSGVPLTTQQTVLARRRVRRVLDACLSETQRGHKHIRKQLTTYLLALAGILSSHTWALAGDDNLAVVEDEFLDPRWIAIVNNTWRDLGRDEFRHNLYYDKTKMLVSELAELSGCPTHSRMEHLMHYCDQVDQLRVSDLEHLRFDAAFYLANRTMKFHDRSFAERLTKENGNVSLASWRWDDGISEWVTKTPVVPTQARTTSADNQAVLADPPSPSPQVEDWGTIPGGLDELAVDNDDLGQENLGGGVVRTSKRVVSARRRQPLRRISNQRVAYSSDDELGI